MTPAKLERIDRNRYVTPDGLHEARLLDDGRVRVWRTPCRNGPLVGILGTYRWLSEAAHAIAADQPTQTEAAP